MGLIHQTKVVASYEKRRNIGRIILLTTYKVGIINNLSGLKFYRLFYKVLNVEFIDKDITTYLTIISLKLRLLLFFIKVNPVH